MTDYEKGSADAAAEMEEGWTPANLDKEQIAAHLRMAIGASDEYIQGYLSKMEGK